MAAACEGAWKAEISERADDSIVKIAKTEPKKPTTILSESNHNGTATINPGRPWLRGLLRQNPNGNAPAEIRAVAKAEHLKFNERFPTWRCTR